MKISALVLTVLLSLAVAPAKAQDTAELVASIAAQQKQIDQLQALVLRLTKTPDNRLRVWMDEPQINAGAVFFQGWGFECASQTTGKMEVQVDGIVVTNSTFAMERPDVWAAAPGICEWKGGAPWWSGVFGIVSLANYAPGPHTISLRITKNGVMAVSNQRVFVRD
jgi:hypothetical protein